MAIPPANPPPRYEPIPRRDTAHEPLPMAPRDPQPPGRLPPGLAARERGCLIVVGVIASLACIGSTAIAVGCQSFWEQGQAQALRQVSAAYRAAARGTPEQEADEADLRALEDLADHGQLTFLAFSVLSNRYNDALVSGGTIDADELRHGMELVHDIVEGQGTIVLDDYPDGR